MSRGYIIAVLAFGPRFLGWLPAQAEKCLTAEQLQLLCSSPSEQMRVMSTTRVPPMGDEGCTDPFYFLASRVSESFLIKQGGVYLGENPSLVGNTPLPGPASARSKEACRRPFSPMPILGVGSQLSMTVPLA